MSTRHLVCVVKNGEYKLAQYGQNDGSPDWCGVDILHFLTGERMDDFLKNLEKCVWADYNIGKTTSYAADILEKIAEAEEGLKLYDFHEFAYRSIPCEWAYVIDLDEECLEVYKGRNELPLDPTERFASGFCEDFLDRTYYPVRCVGSFDLKKLPDEHEFIRTIQENIRIMENLMAEKNWGDQSPFEDDEDDMFGWEDIGDSAWTDFL